MFLLFHLTSGTTAGRWTKSAKVIVRYQFVTGGRTGALEIECAKLAYSIYERRVTDATSAYKELRAVYPNDDLFQAAFREMREASAPKTTYLLRELEHMERKQRFGAAAVEVSGPYSIEHVLPKSPGPDWVGEEVEDEEELASRVGNLCLLSRTTNTQLGGASFAKKKEAYRESDVLLTRQIADQPEWGKRQIEHRQARLAKLAVQAWRFQ